MVVVDVVVLVVVTVVVDVELVDGVGHRLRCNTVMRTETIAIAMVIGSYSTYSTEYAE